MTFAWAEGHRISAVVLVIWGELVVEFDRKLILQRCSHAKTLLLLLRACGIPSGQSVFFATYAADESEMAGEFLSIVIFVPKVAAPEAGEN